MNEQERKELAHRCVKAAKDDDRQTIKDCLEIDPTIIDEYAANFDQAPLSAAIWNGHEELAHWLLDQGADPLTPKQPREAFHGSVIRQQVSVLQRLIDAGEDLGITLHYASRREQHDSMRTLLAAGADPNRKAPNGELDGMEWRGIWHRGETALHLAARRGDIKAVQILRDAGADPSIVDAHNESALAWFSRYRAHDPAMGFDGDKRDAMAKLLAYGMWCDSFEQTLNYESPKLCVVAETGESELVRRLLEDGEDVNAACPTTGETPLHQAATFNHVAVARLLLAAGADPNAKAKVGVPTKTFWRDVPVVGETPFHRAAGYACRELIAAMVEAGADANILDANGEFGLTWFSRNVNWNRHEDITSRDEVGKMVAPDEWKDKV